MKIFLIFALLLIGRLPMAHAQQDPDSKYLTIYGMIELGEKQAMRGQPADALATFTDAQMQLMSFHRQFPDWNPAIINFRQKMIAEKIAALKPLLPAPKVVETQTVTTSVTAPATTEPAPQLKQLNEQLQSAQSENAALQAKLKEALAAQPAVADASELAKTQSQLRSLMQENDLLKASQLTTKEKIVTQVGMDTNALAQAKADLADYVKKYAAQQAQVEQLTAEKAQLKTSVDRREAELAQAKTALDDYLKKSSSEQARAIQLAAENEVLNRRLKAAAPSGDNLTVLQEENARLKAQIESLHTAATSAPDVAKLTADLQAAQAQITALKAAAAVVASEKATLEKELSDLKAGPKADVASYELRLRNVSDERDRLQRKLDEANRKIAKRKGGDSPAEIAKLRQELDTLRARLAVSEAKAIPYTPEELALFRATVPSAPVTSKKSIKEMPVGTAELVASAQQHFAKQELPQAEADYHQILERDQNNGIALANLATIEVQAGKLDDAEKHLQAALQQSPDDAYNLSTLGYLKFRQEKYNEAYDVLSRAAKLDPNNPEIQNYLGVTLSHKGLRIQAETALRKAITLKPNFAPAHNNLAVIYLTGEPSSPLLARWHYQKALAAGQPRNPDLEKALADKGAPVEGQ